MDSDYANDVLNTALALQALKAANYPDLSVSNPALAYLTNSQNPDGGWGFVQGDDSNVYLTAVVSSTLQLFPQTTTIATAINKASAFLISHQNTDGGFGTSPSTVYETALAYSALVAVSTDATVLGNAVNYLTTTQAADGSWNQDPYSTALALKALFLSENRPTPPPIPPTTGTVMGIVVASSTNQPLSGVTVTLVSDPSLTTTTDTSGSFTLNNIPQGSQQITLTMDGFAPLTLTTKITAGSFFNVGKVGLSVNPTSGIIMGTIWDADANAPFPGVTVMVVGTLYMAQTATDGTYRITGVPPGTWTVGTPWLSKPNYYGAPFTGTLAPGGIMIYSPALSTNPPPGGLKGTVTDIDDSHPIQGATITLSPQPDGVTPVLTDESGAFSIPGIPVGSYMASVSAPGYDEQSFQFGIVARGETKVNITLVKQLASSTLAGKILDASTGSPIANADVTITGTGIKTTSAKDGSYFFSNITSSAFTVRASAAGYDSISREVNAAVYGAYTLDLGLNPSKVSTARILSLSTDRAAYSADANVSVTAAVENVGDTALDTSINAEITDSAGSIVAIVNPANPFITIDPHVTSTVTMTWNTAQFGTGEYKITIKATEPVTGGYGNAAPFVLATLSTGFSITPSASIAGALSLTPPVALATMQTPVAIRAAVTNSGNVPISTTLKLEVSLSGSVVYTREEPIADMTVNSIKELNFGSFIPLEGGNYAMTLKPNDPSISSAIAASLYVGPNVSALFTASPEKAIRGNPTVTATIKLTGVGGTTGMVQDPLIPLIKSAIQKGVNWEQANAVSWQSKNRCFGCHLQSQTLIGMELSRDKVSVDDSKSQLLLDYMKTCQTPAGYQVDVIGHTSYSVPFQATTLYAWSLSVFHDSSQIREPLTKAVDYLISRQSASGFWLNDYYWGVNDLWNDLGQDQPSTPFTAYNIISLAKAYELTGLQKFKDSALKAVNYLNGADHTKSVVTAAHIVIGLKAAEGLIDDPTVLTAVDTKVSSVIAYIRSKQNSDGGWGRYAGNSSDPLPTAHVLFAMSHADIRGDDQCLRNGTTYLLNKQNADGTWTTAFVRATTIPDRHFGVTTWAVISLPLALDTIAGVSADLKVILSSDVVMTNSTIQPDRTSNSGSETTYVWNFKGLTESEKELQLGFILQGMQLGEERNVAREASISFNDSYTGNMVIIQIDIPVVTGIASTAIGTAVNKPQFGADENVNITTTLTNNGSMIRSQDVQLLVEEQSGNMVAQVTSFTDNALEPTVLPGWSYRIPASLTATKDISNKIAGVTIDFSAITSALGITGKTVDPNSIRVIEVDAANNLIGEKQATATFLNGNYSNLRWYLDGLTPMNSTRNFLIYFDTTDHGTKPASQNTRLPATGGLVGYIDVQGGIYLLENRRDGTFGSTQYVDDLNPVTDNSIGIVLDDFNDDGFTDIIAGSGYNGKIYYYQNKGDGTNAFNPKVEIGAIDTNSWVMGMTAADFNNDGKKDFVVSGNNTALYLFNGDGKGAFSQATITAPQGTTRLRGKVGADFNGDGIIDLLIADNPSGGIFLYRGNGDGTFAATVRVGTSGIDPPGLVVGDFDEDGKLDFIAGTGSSGEALFFKGNGDGTFAAAVLISPNTFTYAGFETGDFTNDGHLDLLAITYDRRTIEYYPGRGNGTFESKVLVATVANDSVGISLSPPLTEMHPLIGSPETIPGQSFGFIWNTGSTPPGNYRVHAILTEAQETISESYASFAIAPDIRTDAQVVTDKIGYNPNEVAVITSTMTSLSRNAILENLSAKVTISTQGPAGNTELFAETKNIPTLMPGASFTFKSYWNTGTNPPGSCLVTLELRDAAGALLSTGARDLVINSVTTPGALLNGQISLDKQSILTGDPVTVSYSVTNTGNIDLSNIALTLRTVAMANQTEYDTIADQATLAMGATYVNSGRIDTQGYGAKDYLVVLRASIDGVEETLASTFFRVEGAPSAPALSGPASGADVESFTPTLSVSNAADPNDDKLTYEFEIYADSGLTNIVTSGMVSETAGSTTWTVPAPLAENNTYFWRARAYDGRLYGPWMTPASFRVNTLDDPPTAPTIASPADGAAVAVLTPMLTINNASDPDSANLTYNFDLAPDPDFTQITASAKGITSGQGATSWTVPVSLAENGMYYWRAQADDWLMEGPWSTTARFFVNTANDAPSAPTVTAPASGATVTALETDIVVANSTDPDSSTLSYFFETDTAPTFDSTSIIRSGSTAEGENTTLWHVGGLRDNTQYYARVRASDGTAESPWSAVSGFFANTVNDPPTTPTLANPSNGAGINMFTPILSVHDATDPDKDALAYEFEAYADAAMTNLIAQAGGIAETAEVTAWQMSASLTENQTCYWRARAYDGALHSGWMPAASFLVNTANDAPGAPRLSSPAEGSSVATLTPPLAVANAVDPDSDNLTYDFEIYSGGTLVTATTAVPEDSSGVTAWTPDTALADNTVYQWRARAYDGDSYGPWTSMAAFTVHMPKMSINATIDFDPDTLNKSSKGTWVVVYIELPVGHKPADIDIPSVRLEGTIPAETQPYAIGDHDKDGIPDLMVKFKRSGVIDLLADGESVPVHVKGKAGSTPFEGVDLIRVSQ